MIQTLDCEACEHRQGTYCMWYDDELAGDDLFGNPSSDECLFNPEHSRKMLEDMPISDDKTRRPTKATPHIEAARLDRIRGRQWTEVLAQLKQEE